MAEARRSSRAAKPRDPTNHVLVDFENVPTVDLSLIGDKTTMVTLLIGEKQRRLELGLVRQIHEHAAKVNLVEVGASGRNALDLVLAWHLGKTAERHPGDPFFVVSKDKDFDPLIVHLRAHGLSIIRVEAFAMLPFLSTSAPTKKPPVSRRLVPLPISTIVRKPEQVPMHDLLPAADSPPDPSLDERLPKLIDRLRHKTKARPVRRKTLLSYVSGFYGKQLTESELEAIVSILEQRGIIDFDAQRRVRYLDPAATVAET